MLTLFNHNARRHVDRIWKLELQALHMYMHTMRERKLAINNEFIRIRFTFGS